MIILLTCFENVNKFRERAVHKQMIGYLNKLNTAESKYHDMQTKVKGIPLVSTHWLDIDNCINGS